MNHVDGTPTAVVTGAAGALGGATTEAFLAKGYRVVGLDVDPAVVERQQRSFLGLAVDLTDEHAVAEVMTEVAGHGSLEHFVGIAGGALPEEPPTQHDLVELAPAVFRGSLERNLTSQYVALRAVLPWLRQGPSRDRSATLVSSYNAMSAQGMPAYSAAKAGLIGMMHALVRPLGAEGIRINVVAPGTIRTPRTERIWGQVEGHFERLEETSALGRLGLPDHVARTCLSLATELTHVCGQVLVVDGGQSA